MTAQHPIEHDVDGWHVRLWRRDDPALPFAADASELAWDRRHDAVGLDMADALAKLARLTDLDAEELFLAFGVE